MSKEITQSFTCWSGVVAKCHYSLLYREGGGRGSGSQSRFTRWPRGSHFPSLVLCIPIFQVVLSCQSKGFQSVFPRVLGFQGCSWEMGLPLWVSWVWNWKLVRGQGVSEVEPTTLSLRELTFHHVATVLFQRRAQVRRTKLCNSWRKTSALIRPVMGEQVASLQPSRGAGS